MIYLDDRPLVGVDTEGSKVKVWSVQFAITPGTGYTLRDQSAIDRFHQWLIESRPRPLISLHSSLFDIPVLKRVGIDVIGEELEFCDTMVLAYALGVEPQGLKPLCYRHAGMLQDSYDDIIGDAGYGIAFEYLCRVAGAEDAPLIVIPPPPFKTPKRRKKESESDYHTRLAALTDQWTVEHPPTTIRQWPDPDPELVFEGNGVRVKKSQGVAKLVDRILADIMSGKVLKDGEETDPRARWEKLSPAAKAPVVAVIGDMREPDLDDIPLPRAIRYASRDADAQLRITKPLWDKVKAMNLEPVAHLDHSVIPIIYRMSEVGIQLAPVAFWDNLEAQCESQMAKAKYDIHAVTGREINPGSGDQVAELLYGPISGGGLGLTPPMMTDGGESGKIRGSTNDKCLEALLAESPVVECVEQYREADKVRGTYVAKLREMAREGDGRARVTFKITRQVTGRFTTAEPMNLLSIPVRSELGAQCRYGFVASPGKVMFDADLCMAEGTPVDTPYGDRAIEDLNIGDMVFSLDENGRPCVTRVRAKKFTGEKRCFRVHLDTGESFACTEDHKIAVRDGHGGWEKRRLRDLSVDARLVALHRQLVQGRWNLYSLSAFQYVKQALAVAKCSLGVRPSGHHVHHVNECCADDRSENLEYKPRIKHWQDHASKTLARVNQQKRVKELRKALKKRRSYKGDGNPRWGYRKGHSAVCLYCHTSFYQPPVRSAKFCSRQCYLDACASGLNHKIVAIDSCGVMPTWDIEVEAPSHVFALGCGVYVSNSQIEMRTFAHLSRDPKLCKVFIDGAKLRGDEKKLYDIHNRTASEMFGTPIKQVEKWQRQSGKVVGFFLINGGTSRGLVNQMILFKAYRKDGTHWTEDDCAQMIDGWFGIYPGCRQFQKRCIAETQTTGIARDPLSGRIRYLPQIWAPQRQVREEAERCSYAHLIQTSANTILKRAMASIWEGLRGLDGWSPELPVHDEILAECWNRPDDRDLVQTVTEGSMTQTTKLIVPIETDGKFGDSWGSAH